MATITPTQVNSNGYNDHDGVVVTWGPMLNGDVGAAVALPGFTKRSVQVAGTFGAGGSVAFEGSNDGTNFVALPDTGGTAIAITGAGIKGVLETAVFKNRPHVTAGDGTTSLTVTVYFGRTVFLR